MILGERFDSDHVPTEDADVAFRVKFGERFCHVELDQSDETLASNLTIKLKIMIGDTVVGIVVMVSLLLVVMEFQRYMSKGFV